MVRMLLILVMLLAGCAEVSPRKPIVELPDAANLLREGGKAYAEGNCKVAIEKYLQLIEQVPDDVDSMLKIAQCTYREGDATGAMAQYQRILRISPSLRPAHYNLLYLQLNALVATSKGVIENVPPETDDEVALVELATQIMAAVTELVDDQRARRQVSDAPP